MAVVRLTHRHINRKRIGPYSRAHLLATVDARSQVGKYMRDLSRELAAHIGAPTTAQRLLIQQAVLKAAKLGLLVDKILSDTEPDLDLAARCYLAWSGSLRRDLAALGIERPAAQAPAIADFLAARRKSAG